VSRPDRRSTAPSTSSPPHLPRRRREVGKKWSSASCAGRILTGEATVEEVGREIYDRMLRVASGEKSKSEAQGLGDYEFVPWLIGAVM
jgi:hypothetical protein